MALLATILLIACLGQSFVWFSREREISIIFVRIVVIIIDILSEALKGRVSLASLSQRGPG